MASYWSRHPRCRRHHRGQRWTYVVTLLLSVVTASLLVAPAAVHRFTFQRGLKMKTVLLGHRMFTVGLARLALTWPAGCWWCWTWPSDLGSRSRATGRASARVLEPRWAWRTAVGRGRRAGARAGAPARLRHEAVVGRRRERWPGRGTWRTRARGRVAAGPGTAVRRPAAWPAPAARGARGGRC